MSGGGGPEKLGLAVMLPMVVPFLFGGFQTDDQ